MAEMEPKPGTTEKAVEHSTLDSNFPVLLPYYGELLASDEDFTAFVASLKPTVTQEKDEQPEDITVVGSEKADTTATAQEDDADKQGAPFMDAMITHKALNVTQESLEAENKMLTENADVAHRSTQSPLVDLFFELEDVASGDRLEKLLSAAWAEDSTATLKIIFNARSIHLGKAGRFPAYKALGWLYTEHPRTLLANLVWLTRPIIEKKVEKKKAEKPSEDDKGDDDLKFDDEVVMVDAEGSDPGPGGATPTEHDVKNGVAHGYWKDLLNLLALAVNDRLNVNSNPCEVLNVKNTTKPVKREWSQDGAKKVRAAKKIERHDRAVKKLDEDPVYRALHFTIARLFASQLKRDSDLLAKKKSRSISLAAKWAPSLAGFHDSHTLIVSSISELLHSHEATCPNVYEDDRELYLKHAREAYRRLTLSPLRKALQVVERDITAESFSNIKYEHVPSLAMNNYRGLFIKKDYDHFNEFIDRVAEGKSRVSGATLFPSTLVAKAKGMHSSRSGRKAASATAQLVEQKLMDGQWKTLVQRIRDSGNLKSSIAVCDVSGSMTYPHFPDGTCPMDSSVGLALLLAEITAPPFGGAFISFSEQPVIHKVGGPDDKRSFPEKIRYIMDTDWGYNTDFVAVFEDLILPVAVQNKVSQEDMVKQVFVFSDMQFDAAAGEDNRWTTSFERIQEKFAEAGYEMPQLVFWNLAGGRAGYDDNMLASSGGDETAPKPVTAEEVGTALVSGYSQGQLKMFLEGGHFEEEEPEEEVKDEIMDEDEGDEEKMVGVTKEKKEKAKMDPLAMVKKAVSHKAYSMLTVVD